MMRYEDEYRKSESTPCQGTLALLKIWIRGSLLLLLGRGFELFQDDRLIAALGFGDGVAAAAQALEAACVHPIPESVLGFSIDG